MATRKKKATPAQRAKAKRDPAIFKPPRPIRGSKRSTTAGLRLVAAGRTYPIGEHIEGDTPWGMTVESAGAVTLPVRNPSGKIVRILDDEALLQRDGVRVTVDGVVYCVATVDHDGEGLYTLVLEDEVAWRLRDFSSYRAADRKRSTRFGFIYGFVREASRPPNPAMRAFIPEVDDKQPVGASEKG